MKVIQSVSALALVSHALASGPLPVGKTAALSLASVFLSQASIAHALPTNEQGGNAGLLQGLVGGGQDQAGQAQQGGAGVIVYCRKEGRALGEVTKFLVYNARKRAVGGDRADNYFSRTECVAGVQDMRFQELMPDVLHWLGISRIDRMVSMSNLKYDAIAQSGIEIVERVPIPEELIPADARVVLTESTHEGRAGEEERAGRPVAEDDGPVGRMDGLLHVRAPYHTY